MYSEFFSYWFLQSVAMALTALVLPRLRITGISGALGTVAALAFVNATVWDAALFFSVPNHVSMHVFLLIASNGLLFWVLVKILPGIEVDGIMPALIAPIVFTVLSLIVHHYGKSIDWLEVFRSVVDGIEQFRDGLKEGAAAVEGSGEPVNHP